MTNKTLAVIMSLYKNDVLNYVKLSIESILNQTYKEFDLYLQYDGPICIKIDEYLSAIKDERVHIQRREENKGLAQSLNELLTIVIPMGYEYIARMDADDISMLDRFEKQLTYLEQHPEIDCVGGAINEIDEEGNNKGKVTNYPCEPNQTRAFFCRRNPVAHPTVMMRKSLFEKSGCYYPTEFIRNEDTMLWYKAFLGGAKIANLPDVVLNFRMTNAMFIQRRKGEEFAKSQLRLRKMINQDLEYGIMATVYAYAMYVLMISPTWILKLAYRLLR